MLRLFAAATAAVLCCSVALPARAAVPSPGAGGVSALMAFVDGEFRVDETRLTAAARTPAVRSANWAHMQPQLARLAAANPPGVVFFANRSGTYWVAGKGRQRVSVSDRAYFRAALRGVTTVAQVLTSRSTGKASAVVTVPVLRGGKVVGVLGGGLFLEDLSNAAVRRLNVGGDRVIFAIDGRGVIALHSNRSFILDEPAKDSSAISAVVDRMLREGNGTQSYVFRGRRRSVTFRKSPYTGWIYGYGTQRP